jgi:hypothetical protein
LMSVTCRPEVCLFVSSEATVLVQSNAKKE